MKEKLHHLTYIATADAELETILIHAYEHIFSRWVTPDQQKNLLAKFFSEFFVLEDVPGRHLDDAEEAYEKFIKFTTSHADLGSFVSGVQHRVMVLKGLNDFNQAIHQLYHWLISIEDSDLRMFNFIEIGIMGFSPYEINFTEVSCAFEEKDRNFEVTRSRQVILERHVQMAFQRCCVELDDVTFIPLASETIAILKYCQNDGERAFVLSRLNAEIVLFARECEAQSSLELSQLNDEAQEITRRTIDRDKMN